MCERGVGKVGILKMPDIRDVFWWFYCRCEMLLELALA